MSTLAYYLEWPLPQHCFNEAWTPCSKVYQVLSATLMIFSSQLRITRNTCLFWSKYYNICRDMGFVQRRMNANSCRLQWTDYLGHLVDVEGLHATAGKLEAIIRGPIPQNGQQLRSFLGLVKYHGKFIPNLSTVLHLLDMLLKKDRKWEWSSDAKKAFLSASKQSSHFLPGISSL